MWKRLFDDPDKDKKKSERYNPDLEVISLDDIWSKVDSIEQVTPKPETQQTQQTQQTEGTKNIPITNDEGNGQTEDEYIFNFNPSEAFKDYSDAKKQEFYDKLNKVKADYKSRGLLREENGEMIFKEGHLKPFADEVGIPTIRKSREISITPETYEKPYTEEDAKRDEMLSKEVTEIRLAKEQQGKEGALLKYKELLEKKIERLMFLKGEQWSRELTKEEQLEYNILQQESVDKGFLETDLKDFNNQYRRIIDDIDDVVSGDLDFKNMKWDKDGTFILKNFLKAFKENLPFWHTASLPVSLPANMLLNTVLDTELEVEKAGRINEFIQKDPLFADAFKEATGMDYVETPERSGLVNVINGLAEIGAMLPSFRFSGNLVNEMTFLRPTSFKVTQKIMKDMPDAVHTIAKVGENTIREGAVFGLQSLVSGNKEVTDPMITGSSFGGVMGLTSIIESALPPKYRLSKIINPIAKMIIGGTSFAVGGEVSEMFTGNESDFFEEFGKGVGMVLFSKWINKVRDAVEEGVKKKAFESGDVKQLEEIIEKNVGEVRKEMENAKTEETTSKEGKETKQKSDIIYKDKNGNEFKVIKEDGNKVTLENEKYGEVKIKKEDLDKAYERTEKPKEEVTPEKKNEQELQQIIEQEKIETKKEEVKEEPKEEKPKRDLLSEQQELLKTREEQLAKLESKKFKTKQAEEKRLTQIEDLKKDIEGIKKYIEEAPKEEKLTFTERSKLEERQKELIDKRDNSEKEFTDAEAKELQDITDKLLKADKGELKKGFKQSEGWEKEEPKEQKPSVNPYLDIARKYKVTQEGKNVNFNGTLLPVESLKIWDNFKANKELFKEVTVEGLQLVKKGLNKFRDWSREMVKNLGEWVKPHLRKVWDSVTKGLDKTMEFLYDIKPDDTSGTLGMFGGVKGKGHKKQIDSGDFLVGLDGKRRVEFSDKDAKLKMSFDDIKKMPHGLIVPLQKVIDHPELEKRYPRFFKDIGLRYDPEYNAIGYFDRDLNTIVVGKQAVKSGLLSNFLHEIQHGIDDLEGFARGGNYNLEKIDVRRKREKVDEFIEATNELKRRYEAETDPIKKEVAREKYESFRNKVKDYAGEYPELINRKKLLDTDDIHDEAFQRYYNQAGEIGARETQARQKMSDKERKENPPFQNVDKDKVIVRLKEDKKVNSEEVKKEEPKEEKKRETLKEKIEREKIEKAKQDADRRVENERREKEGEPLLEEEKQIKTRYEKLKENVKNLAHEIKDKGIDAVAIPKWLVEKTVNAIYPDLREFEGKDIMHRNLGLMDKVLTEVGFIIGDYKKVFDKLPIDEGVKFIDRIKRGMKQPTEELQVIADTVRKLEDRFKEDILRYDPDFNWLENHFRVLWKVIPTEDGAGKPKGAWKKIIGKYSLSGSKGFMKQHTLLDMTEGIRKGGVPVSYNPMTLLEMHLKDMMKFITAKRIMSDLKERGIVKFVRNKADDKPSGFVKIKDEIAKVYFPREYEKHAKKEFEEVNKLLDVGKIEEAQKLLNEMENKKGNVGFVLSGEWWAEEKTARLINNYLSKDYIRNNPLGNFFMQIKNHTTQMELAFSPFHFIFESTETVGSQVGVGMQKIWSGAWQRDGKRALQGFYDILTSPFAPVSNYTIGKNIQRYMSNINDPSLIEKAKYFLTHGKKMPKTVEEFMTSERGKEFLKKYPQIAEMIEMAHIGGLELRQHDDLKSLGAVPFMEKWKNDNKFSAILFNGLPALNETVMKPLFEWYIPKLKLGVFVKEMSNELVQRKSQLDKGVITREQLAREVAESVENRLGEANYDRLFWNRTMKSALQLSFRSITWQYGNFSEFGNAFKNQGKEIIRGIKAKEVPLLNRSTAWLLGMTSISAIMGSLVQLAFTGEEPEEWKDFFMPKIDKEGNRVSLPTYWKDILSTAYGGVWKKAGHSLSGFIGRFVQAWQNEDYYGYPIADERDSGFEQWVDRLSHALAIMPFGLESFLTATKNNEPMVNRVLGFFAMPKVPRYLQNTHLENTITERYVDRFGHASKNVEDAMKKEVKDEIRNLLKTGTPEDRDSAYNRIEKALINDELSAQEINNILENTGIPKTVMMFKRLGKYDQQQIAKEMTEEELAIYIPAMKSDLAYEYLSKVKNQDQKDVIEHNYLTNRIRQIQDEFAIMQSHNNESEMQKLHDEHQKLIKRKDELEKNSKALEKKKQETKEKQQETRQLKRDLINFGSDDDVSTTNIEDIKEKIRKESGQWK